MEKVTGRCDDMIILRGVNMFPSQIEEIVLRTPGVAPHFQLELTREGRLDRLTVRAEARPGATPEARRGRAAIAAACRTASASRWRWRSSTRTRWSARPARSGGSWTRAPARHEGLGVMTARAP